MVRKGRTGKPSKKSTKSGTWYHRFVPGWKWLAALIMVMAGLGGATALVPSPVRDSLLEVVQSIGSSPSPWEDPSLETVVGRVRRVVDGDTIIVDYAGTQERIRLRFVDTPESVHSDAKKNTPLGREAASFLRKKLENRQVRVVVDPKDRKDRYGRLLGMVFLENELVNLELVRVGYSPYVDKYGKAGDMHRDFQKAESRAKDSKLGVWAE